MIDVAIVGAGLTGLALAERLRSNGLNVAVYEARNRAGGRILTDGSDQGASVDLGATWFWPPTEPRVSALVESLGLKTFEQPDQGQVLSLSDPNQGPTVMNVQGIHGGARRLQGGTGALIQALLAKLGDGVVRLNRRLVSVIDLGDAVEVVLAQAEGEVEHVQRVRARHVVLTLPPRLIAQHIRFDPALPVTTVDALQGVATWMAREAKSFARFERPFWHAQGQSGSAFVAHAQAMLREVWDASDERGAALAGFSALPAEQRPAFSKSTPLLVTSQFAQLFGAAVQDPSVVSMDWSTEAYTCSDLDRAEVEHEAPQADPILRRPHWGGRLLIGGTETARQAAGHMEGALESASRLADTLRPMKAASPQRPAEQLEAALSDFSLWVEQERQGALIRYRQHLNQLLSRQDYDRPTQRALLQTVEQTYAHALEQLAQLDIRLPDAIQAGRSDLTPRVLAAFSGFSKAMVEAAIDFNAASCALSNFPSEHRPDADYLRVITADLAAAWKEFALTANDLLCDRSRHDATI